MSCVSVFVLILSQKCNAPKISSSYRLSDDSGLGSRSSSFSGCSTLSGSFVSGRIRSNSERVGNVVSVIVFASCNNYMSITITCTITCLL